MKVSILPMSPILTSVKAPFVLEAVQAGFPSPADDYIESTLDLNELFKIDPASTFFVRAEGKSMINTGIMPGDILCVRKDLDVKDGSIVIAAIDNEFTVKRYRKTDRGIIFEAANIEYPDIVPVDGQEVHIWGVVTGIARVFT